MVVVIHQRCTLEKKDQIQFTLPVVLPINQVESALMSSLSPPCNASCVVVYVNSSAGRRLQSESGTFEVTWQLGAESGGNFDASSVNATALAENLGYIGVIDDVSTTVISVEAEVVIVTEVADAQNVLAEQQTAFMPSALANALGVSPNAFTSTTAAITPPMPPPSSSPSSSPLSSSNQSLPPPPAYTSPVVYESTNDYLVWIVLISALLFSCFAYVVSFYINR